jgi:hypothetical protein
LVEVHQAQGELDVLERILGLEAELKEYGKRKMKQELEANERKQSEAQGG